MQMNQQQEPEPDPVKDSKLVDSDNLLMEFQEPSDSEDSSDGLEDMFPNMGVFKYLFVLGLDLLAVSLYEIKLKQVVIDYYEFYFTLKNYTVLESRKLTNSVTRVTGAAAIKVLNLSSVKMSSVGLNRSTFSIKMTL